MKRLILMAILLAAFACKVEKTNGTYKVEGPTPEAKDAAAKAKENAAKAGNDLKRETKELGEKFSGKSPEWQSDREF